MKIVGWASQAVHPEALCSLIGNNCSICSVCSSGCLSCGSILSANVVDLSGTEQITAYVMVIFLFLIMISAVSYTMSILAVGETLMFIIFKNRTDNDNILEKDDEDDIDNDTNDDLDNEEFVNDISKIENLVVVDIAKNLIPEENLDELYSDQNDYGGHYSELGNKKIANLLDQKLRNIV